MKIIYNSFCNIFSFVVVFSLILYIIIVQVPKDEISKIVAVLLRRTDGKDAIYRVLNQLVAEAGTYLVQLSDVFDEIHTVYRLVVLCLMWS